MLRPVTTVRCPSCGTAVPWSSEQRWRPFCSERCRLVDLGHWASEAHRIPGEPAGPGEPEKEQDDPRGLHA